MNINEIEKKYDTAERLQKVAGKPHNTLLFAEEFNAVVDTLKLKGQYETNEEAIAYGLENGDLYNLPDNGNGNFQVAVVRDEVPGLVQVIDKNQDIFNNIETAEAFVATFTENLIESISYESGIYTFSAWQNSSMAGDFCGIGEEAHNLQFLDPHGMFTSFGLNSFNGNTQNNVFGNGVTFKDGCFCNSSGNNTIGYARFGNQCFQGATGNNTIAGMLVKGGQVFEAATGNNTIGNVYVDGGAFFSSSEGNNSFKKYINVTGGSFMSASGTYYFESAEMKEKSHFANSTGVFIFKGKCHADDATFFLYTTGTIHAKPLNFENQEALGYAVANGAVLIQDL